MSNCGAVIDVCLWISVVDHMEKSDRFNLSNRFYLNRLRPIHCKNVLIIPWVMKWQTNEF